MELEIPATDDVRVPIKAWLRGPTFRVLVKLAEHRRQTVGEVLVMLADEAAKQLGGETPRRRPRSTITPDQLNDIIKLWKAGLSTYQIASTTGIPQSTVHRRLTSLNLNERTRA